MSIMEEKQKIPIINFSGVDKSKPGSGRWNEVATQVFQALQSYGCFQALHEHSFTPEFRSEVLSSVRDELFALPLESKLKNTSDKPFHGYAGPGPGFDAERLAIEDPIPHGIPNFVNQLWPQSGNPKFCEAAQMLTNKALEVEAIVKCMVVEALGVQEKHAAQLQESTWYLLRFWEYGKQAVLNEEGSNMSGYLPHTDNSMLSMVWPLNDVNGLEFRSKEGGWIAATPSPSSLIVIAGYSLRAWSNGRIYAPLHRVAVSNNTDQGSIRYSTVLFSATNDEFKIVAPEELVDEQHPRLFKPFTHLELRYFAASEDGKKSDCKLTANFSINA